MDNQSALYRNCDRCRRPTRRRRFRHHGATIGARYAITDELRERLSLRREDVFINLVEVQQENWSFGNGEAQYAK